MILLLEIVLAFSLIVVTYFLLVTRVSLIINSIFQKQGGTAHIYWVYSNRFFIWLTDRPIIISAILFFNYKRLVNSVVERMNPSLEGKRVLQASCAFGNLSQRIAEKCISEGAKKVVIFDLIANEIKHTQKKLEKNNTSKNCSYLVEDAINVAHKDESFDYVVIFFLFHELPFDKKVASLKEAARVLKPGGRLIFAEFHKPAHWILRASGRCFFKVFEPYAYEMWDDFNAHQILNEETLHHWETTKNRFFGGNYQVFTAEKVPN